MKIIVIYGSPRKGMTYEAVQFVKTEMEKNGPVEFVEFRLPQDAPAFCKGCFQCFSTGEATCPDAKYIQPIASAMMEADGFIISTPVYAMQISGALKAFFDHMAYCFINHRPRFIHQKALVIVTTAGAGVKNCLRYITENLRFWGVNQVFGYGQPVLAMDWNGIPPKTKTKLTTALQKYAHIFYHDIAVKKIHRPTFLQAVMYYAGKALMLSYEDDAHPDKAYWRQKGWLENDCRYLSPATKPGLVKSLIGGIAFFAMRRVMKNQSNNHR